MDITPNGEYGSSWGLTDLYDDFAATLRQTIESGKPFRATWGAKKEIRDALVKRGPDGILVTATSHTDDNEELVIDALSELAGDAPEVNAGIGYDGIWQAYLAARGRTDHEGFVNEIVDLVGDDPNLQIHDPTFRSSRIIASESTYEQVIAALSDLEDDAERMAQDNFDSVKATITNALGIPDPEDP